MEIYIIGSILLAFVIREVINYREIRELKFQKEELILLCNAALAKLREEKRKNAYQKSEKAGNIFRDKLGRFKRSRS